MMKRLIPSNEGVVGIVTAFLIVGLIVIVFSVVQTVYVPQWMKENEADHMEAIADQFSQLKFAIDTHSQFKDVNNPMTTSITLGNKEMPVLASSRAYGSIEIIPEQFILKISGALESNSTTSLNTLKYSSSNAYFLDQEYTYEAGAVILSQYQGDTMAIKPSFSITKEGSREYNISINLVNITPVGDKNSISGYGNYPIKTQYISTNEFEIIRISDFSIQTEFSNSWERFLNNSLTQVGLNYSGIGEDKGLHSYYITSDANQVKVVFFTELVINVNIKLIEISAQIAPGWFT